MEKYMHQRWINDYNPDESIESRIMTLINSLTNSCYPDGTSFSGQIELQGWLMSELTSLLYKTQKEQ